MRKRILPLVLLLAVWFPAPGVQGAMETAPGRTLARQATKDKGKLWITADHSKFAVLNQNFTNGDQVTSACLTCHSEAAMQFHKTIHWTWLVEDGTARRQLGKAGDSVNNFCISTNRMNDAKCTKCHTGWHGKNTAVNCLKCHGRKKIDFKEAFEDYQAFMNSDDPDERILAGEVQAEIRQAVQAIGLPARSNCGACHFYGGGGDGVKHGDLDSSLAKPSKELDVHMGIDGQGFKCTRCHTTVLHNIAGRIYTQPAVENRKSLIEDDLTAKITCVSCHSATPHKPGHKANDHTDKVACQSCHIPFFARELPTKLYWDWSTAGRLKDGKKIVEKGPFGKPTYMTIKGDMKWGKNVRPEYFWFNGSITSLTIKDVIDPSSTVAVSRPMGGADDPQSRIFPFKIHHGRQPYDKINKHLLAPLLSGPEGYWANLDWDAALQKGMDFMGVEYSGQYDFVDTTYVFPITHMVAPKEKALDCRQCHNRNDSRLAKLTGLYMPGRDNNSLVDTMGSVGVLGALLGVVLHGLGRIFTSGAKED